MKSVRIRSFSFSPNAAKYGLVKLQIRTLFYAVLNTVIVVVVVVVVVVCLCVCVCMFTSIHREGFICLEQLGLPGNRSTMLC